MSTYTPRVNTAKIDFPDTHRVSVEYYCRSETTECAAGLLSHFLASLISQRFGGVKMSKNAPDWAELLSVSLIDHSETVVQTLIIATNKQLNKIKENPLTKLVSIPPTERLLHIIKPVTLSDVSFYRFGTGSDTAILVHNKAQTIIEAVSFILFNCRDSTDVTDYVYCP